jgi:flagellar protein FlaI
VTGGDERRDVRDGDGCDASDGSDASDANDASDASDASDGSVAREGRGRVKIVEDLEEDVDIATICDLSATVCQSR